MRQQQQTRWCGSMKLNSAIVDDEFVPALPPMFPLLRFPRFSWLSRLLWPIQKFFKNLKRSLDYAQLGWGNYDWDYGFLFSTLRFKLERMNAFLSGENAMATHSSAALKSIRIAARLAKKLEEEDYNFFIDRHREKWRDVKVFEDVEPSDQDRRAGIAKIMRAINTPETAIERKEYLRAAEADENIRKRDARWLFSIMEKHYPSWWD